MKAVILTNYGSVDKLQFRDVPEPKLGPTDVKVRVAGASINPIDWKVRSGAFKEMMPLDLPVVLGRDASGTVVEVGARVSDIRVGARVMGLTNGGYAEYVVAPEDAWTKVPAKIDIVDAGALPLVLLTGAQLIEEAVKPKKGDRVLVTGALGSVGRAAVFVAKSRGARVWAGVRGSQRKAAEKLGTEGIVAIDDDAEIQNLPVLDSIADTVGGSTIEKLLGRVKAGGTIGSVVGEPVGAKERGLVVRTFRAHKDSKRLGGLALAIVDGVLTIPIARRFPLSEAGKAQALAEKGASGKVLLTV